MKEWWKAGTSENNHYKGSEHSDTFLQFGKNHGEKEFGLNNVQLLQGIFQYDTGHIMQNEKFCLVHIDVDAYVSTKRYYTHIWIVYHWQCKCF